MGSWCIQTASKFTGCCRFSPRAETVTLIVAMADPTTTVAVGEVRFLCGLDVRIAVASPTAVREAIDRLYGDAPELADALSELGPTAHETDRPDDGGLDEAATAQAPVVRFVKALL